MDIYIHKCIHICIYIYSYVFVHICIYRVLGPRRYETMDEWVGLLRAQQATVDAARWDTTAGRAAGRRIVQVTVFCVPHSFR